MTLFENIYSVEEKKFEVSQKILDNFQPFNLSISGKSLITTPVFDAYWYFAAARQSIFHRKYSLKNSPSSFLADPILEQHRFTNAYRASDRVSQYLIRNVIGKSEDDVDSMFFKIMLFKIFNKIETWEALRDAFGQPSLRNFSFDKYNSLLSERQESDIRNYSAAYIMPSAGNVFGYEKKHSNHLALLQWMLDKNFPQKLKRAKNMKEGYELLLSAPSFGPFLAYQFITDINYSNITDFSEMEFVIAGPGAHDGISKCFENCKDITAEQIIEFMAQNQSLYLDKFNLQFENLWGRELQLIDCQNLFCEISKYSRLAFPAIKGVSGRTKIKQKYKQSKKPPPAPVYPEKWGINEKIQMMNIATKNVLTENPHTSRMGHQGKLI